MVSANVDPLSGNFAEAGVELMEDLTADLCAAELADPRYCTVKWEVAAKASNPDCNCKGIDKV